MKRIHITFPEHVQAWNVTPQAGTLVSTTRRDTCELQPRAAIPPDDLGNGKYWKHPSKTTGVNFSILRPNTMGNPHPSLYLCEVRQGGWLMDRYHFETPEQARDWGEEHDGEMSYRVANVYVAIVEEKEKEAMCKKQ